MNRKTTVISHIYSNPLVDINRYNVNGVENTVMLPVELLSHLEEHKLLTDIIQKSRDRFPITFHSLPATIESFQSCYKSSKILHFSGKRL